jgi:hypothetical protein
MWRCNVALERPRSISYAGTVTEGGRRGTSSSTIVSLKKFAPFPLETLYNSLLPATA